MALKMHGRYFFSHECIGDVGLAWYTIASCSVFPSKGTSTTRRRSPGQHVPHGSAREAGGYTVDATMPDRRVSSNVDIFPSSTKSVLDGETRYYLSPSYTDSTRVSHAGADMRVDCKPREGSEPISVATKNSQNFQRYHVCTIPHGNYVTRLPYLRQ